MRIYANVCVLCVCVCVCFVFYNFTIEELHRRFTLRHLLLKLLNFCFSFFLVFCCVFLCKTFALFRHVARSAGWVRVQWRPGCDESTVDHRRKPIANRLSFTFRSRMQRRSTDGWMDGWIALLSSALLCSNCNQRCIRQRNDRLLLGGPSDRIGSDRSSRAAQEVHEDSENKLRARSFRVCWSLGCCSCCSRLLPLCFLPSAGACIPPWSFEAEPDRPVVVVVWVRWSSADSKSFSNALFLSLRLPDWV